MATITDNNSHPEQRDATRALREEIANLSLGGVADSMRASRYAVSAVDGGNVPTLVGAQVGGNTGTGGLPRPVQIVGRDSVQVAQTANLATVQLVGDSATPAKGAIYGASTAGALGYQAISTLVKAGTNVTITVNADGSVTVSSTGGGGSPMNVTTVSGNHTLAPADVPDASSNVGWIEQTSATSNTITIDLHANQACKVGCDVYIREGTGGTTTIVGVSGVVLKGPTITDGGAFSVGRLVQIATDVWAVFGNIPWIAGFTSTTLNPAKTGSNLTLSGGNLVATNATSSYSSSITVAGKTSGKYYYELTSTQSSDAGGDDYLFGVADGSQTLSSYIGSDAHGWGIQGSTGTSVYFYHNGSYTTASSSNWIQGNGYIVGCAFSGDGAGNWKVWYRDTTGAWLSGDPVAGTSPSFTITGVTTLYGAFSSKIHGSGNVIGTLNFGPSFHMSLPTGYSGIGV